MRLFFVRRVVHIDTKIVIIVLTLGDHHEVQADGQRQSHQRRGDEASCSRVEEESQSEKPLGQFERKTSQRCGSTRGFGVRQISSGCHLSRCWELIFTKANYDQKKMFFISHSFFLNF